VLKKSIIFFCLLLLVILSFIFNAKFLFHMQERKQKIMVFPQLNNVLYNYAETNGLKGNIITDYQILGFLPGLEQKYRLSYFKEVADVVQQINEKESGYVLICYQQSVDVAGYLKKIEKQGKIIKRSFLPGVTFYVIVKSSDRR
jgi:hypothetical protein